ncbi:hypothetical protein GcM3_081006 [Golovinomyces cichoracearum]|uniref:Uncharacterized protein n=1 Tax=Golovinomyces cichoracearum TaxID=62708 RepID=A0A420INM8_9PEZI|nr:hypothetical protein GcM3_081006 [Golovinomyces cichoracearum]
MLLVSTSTIFILFASLTSIQAQPIEDHGSALINRASTASVSTENLRRDSNMQNVSKIQVHSPPRNYRIIRHSDRTKDLTSRDVTQEQQAESGVNFRALVQGRRGASRHQIDTIKT